MQTSLILPDLELPAQTMRLGLWLVGLGKDVVQGQPLVEIIAGAAVVDLPSPVDGKLVEKLVDEDTAVGPGAVLAIIESTD
ncbi:MAG: lipoyl domain-containing protein [Pirellulales bacterium]|nr:lipoyl domain-containing protein [Pirellulales bacterium]